MYKTIFLVAYYGLFRIGELASGSHPVKAANVHIAQNKNKMLFVLYSSKTHGKEVRPQKIKISESKSSMWKGRVNTFFCPFKLSREYLALRGNFINDQDPFFVHRDHSPVRPEQVLRVLKCSLKAVNLPAKCYSFHSIRIGASTDLVLDHNLSIDQLKIAGRWKSNTVFKYIRKF